MKHLSLDGRFSTGAGTRPIGRVGATLLSLPSIALLVVVAALLFAFLVPVTRQARPAARQTQCRNNLKQIGLALHNYADEWKVFPPAYTVDANGKPLHSWRTLLLPYLDQSPLYNRIDFSKAWDDPANAPELQREG